MGAADRHPSLRKRITRRLARAGLSWYDMYYGETSLAEAIAPVASSLDLRVGPATGDEHARIAERLAPPDRAVFERARRLGSECWVARVGEDIAGYSWVNRERIDIPGCLTRPLPPGAAYSYGSFVFPSYRGHHVFQSLIRSVSAVLKAERLQFVINFVNATNVPSIAARRRFGTRLQRVRVLKLPLLPAIVLGRWPRNPAVAVTGAPTEPRSS